MMPLQTDTITLGDVYLTLCTTLGIILFYTLCPSLAVTGGIVIVVQKVIYGHSSHCEFKVHYTY